MENQSEIVEVQLGNYKIFVDCETANQLRNDAQYAAQYLNEVEAQMMSSGKRDSQLWKSSKNPTTEDRETTLTLLSLRKQLNDKFSDKKTPKNSLWAKIAKELNEMGFFVGEGVDGREKCRQKFANLSSSYIKTKDRRRQTGEGKVVDPPFFNEMDEILGDRHLSNPVLIIDSADPTPLPYPIPSNSRTTIDADEELELQAIGETPSTSREISRPGRGNRFTNISNSVRHSVAKRSDVLLQIHEENLKVRKTEFEKLVELMTVQNNQRERTNDILDRIANSLTKSKKRKKPDPSDSEDD